jgi:hypothetical protein
MEAQIRKTVRYVEDIAIEGGRETATPVRMIAAAVVIRNPWAGRGYVENLRPEILAIAPGLARYLSTLILDEAGGAARVQACGKAAIVGTAGEIEHGAGLIHTLRFGNIYREAAEGKNFLSFTNTRIGAGGSIVIPMTHKLDGGTRSHFISLQFAISDAPAPDEIIIALGASTGGRLHPRIGDRYLDMEEMKAEA